MPAILPKSIYFLSKNSNTYIELHQNIIFLFFHLAKRCTHPSRLGWCISTSLFIMVKSKYRYLSIQARGLKKCRIILFISVNFLICQVMILSFLLTVWAKVAKNKRPSLLDKCIYSAQGLNQMTSIHPMQHKIAYNKIIRVIGWDLMQRLLRQMNLRKCLTPRLDRFF